MHITINNRKIGEGYPVYIIAEMSANHHQDFHQAVSILKEAAKAGADAVKLQTYTPDTLTIPCDKDFFRIDNGRIWGGKNLYDLYREAYTPWEWQPRLKQEADRLGIDLFSSPFDPTAVDFLEQMNVPAYKIASFEIVDIPLIQYIARTGKPMILSTGMASQNEIREAVNTIHRAGNSEVALLKCTSAYPATVEEMNLRTIAHMTDHFKIPVGLSDHTLDDISAIAAVALGACIVEKHITLSRSSSGPDSSFSMEIHEFERMVKSIRLAEKSLGAISYQPSQKEQANRMFRRSLFAVAEIRKNEVLTHENVRSIRPAHGLHTRYLPEIIGRKASRDIEYGTPISWELIQEG
jgi:pseudaminic acid synthase